MIAKSLQNKGLAIALAGLSLLACAGAYAQTDDGDGDEGLRRTASSSAEPMRPFIERLRQRFEYLRASGSPRDWALASQMPPFDFGWNPDATHDERAEAARKGRADRADLLRNAAAAAPDDKLVQWLALYQMPNASEGCSTTDAPIERAEAVQRLEPGNALAWVPTLQRAVDAKDAFTIDATLAKMAAAERFDNHRGEYVLALLDVDKRDSAPLRIPPVPDMGAVSDDDMAFVMAMGQGETIGASLHVTDEVCDAGKETDADLRRYAACADLGRRLSREASDQKLRVWGFRLLRQSAQFDAEDEANEREFRWLEFQTQRLTADLASYFDVMREAKAAWLAEHDDVAVMRALLETHGISPTPPIGWMPAATGDESVAAPDGDDQ